MVRTVQAFLVNLFQLLPVPFRNKYMLCFCIFFIWMVFFDRNRLITQFELENIAEKLDDDKKFYKEHLQKTLADRKEFEKNKERFAREKYFMQKPNEEIYIIED